MSFAPRPHPIPCACAECSEWARAIVATPSIERKPARAVQAVAEGMPLADFSRSIIALACRATGLSEEQLRERAAQMGQEIPNAPVEATQRDSRDAVERRRVPEIHIEAIYDREPQACPALTAVRAFIANPRQVLLVLSGGVGVYKTGSACWALTCKPGRFVPSDELGRLAGSREGEDVNQWRATRGTPLLVVDDLGGEYVDDKGWMVKVVNGLVDYRYSNRLKTIITTNLDAKTFKLTYQDRVFDRVREAGQFVNIGGKSMRRTA